MKRPGGRPGAAGPPPRRPDLDLFPFAAPAPTAEAPSRAPRAVETPTAVAGGFGTSAATAVSVRAVTLLAKDVLEGAFIPLWIRGEVTGLKVSRYGHWYFALRDGVAQVRCVVFAADTRTIPAPPDEGMQVSVLGQPTIYPARGEMQVTVTAMEAAGDGLWRKALEQARARLAADGLLAPERKRPLPRFPRRIAVVTSPDGAALHDIAVVLRRRWPMSEIILAAARVQGDGAVEELTMAIERVSRWGEADLVIVGRGGGAREDLWAFNDERVARALAHCRVPTISAVGHEIDVTLCDLVADHRAPTPSAAAEAAVPVVAEARAALNSYAASLRTALERRSVRGRERLQRAARSLRTTGARGVERREAHLRAVAGRLHALGPLATLARGYALARDEQGRTLASVSAFRAGGRFELLLRDGSVSATATDVRPGETPPRGGA